MSRKLGTFISQPQEKTPAGPCTCRDYNAVHCLSLREGERDDNFSACMGGCWCHCHRTKHGGVISRTEWKVKRNKPPTRTYQYRVRPASLPNKSTQPSKERQS